MRQKRMTFKQWLKLGVTFQDLRLVEAGFDGLDGYDFFRSATPVPGVLFIEPFDGFPSDAVYRPNTIGVITQSENGMWSVQLCNQEREFSNFHTAAKWLWDNHWSTELDPGPRYRLIGVDSDGTILTNRLCETFYELEQIVRSETSDYADDIIEQLKKVGSRYAEFPYGHYVAFPLDD